MKTKIRDAYLKRLQKQLEANKKYLDGVASAERAVDRATQQLSETREKIETLMKDGDISSETVTDQVLSLKKKVDELVDRIEVAQQHLESCRGTNEAELLRGTKQIAEEIFREERQVTAQLIKGDLSKLSKLMGEKLHILNQIDALSQELADDDLRTIRSLLFACDTQRSLSQATELLSKMEYSISQNGYCFATTMELIKGAPVSA